MTREETFNIICTLLEEGGDIETVGGRILDALEVIGEDLLDHLDPPVGLRRWLESHGLSLVVTSEVTPPQVWDAIQGEAVEPVEERLEIEPAPQLGLGDYVEYRTATAGPRGQSSMGSGHVEAITSEGWVVVRISVAQTQWVNLATDSVRVSQPPAS